MNSNKNLIRKITKPSLKNREIEDKILSAAKNLFLSKGYNKTTIREIASAAGINFSLVNYHYHSKANLAQIVGKDIMDEMIARINRETEMLNFGNAEKLYIENVMTWIYTAENPEYEKFFIEFLIDTSECDSMTVNFYNRLVKVLEDYDLKLTEEENRLAWLVFKGSEKHLIKELRTCDDKTSYLQILSVLMTDYFFNIGISPDEIKRIKQT